MEKTKVTEYGGSEGAMVDGVKDGKGVSRIVKMDISAGQLFSKADIIKAAASDLKNTSVPVMMTYKFMSEEKTYGWADNPGSVGAVGGPQIKLVAEKVTYGVQTEVKANTAPGAKEEAVAKVIAEKLTYGLQEAAGDSNSLPKA